MAEKKEGYIRKQVADILNMKPSTIQAYTDRKIVIPQISNPTGRGTTRKYSKKNLMELLITRELANKGINLLKLKQIFEIILKRDYAEFLGCWYDPENQYMKKGITYMVVYDHDSENITVAPKWRNEPKKIDVDMANHDSAVILNITALWNRIKEKF